MTADIEMLRALLARVEAAKKPCYILEVLDRAIWPEHAAALPPRCYTSEVDAAISLVEKATTPNWDISRNCGGATATVYDIGGLSRSGDGANPALALLTAMLKVLIARADS